MGKAFAMKRSRKQMKRKKRGGMNGDSMMRASYILGGGIVVAVLGIIAISVVTGRGGSATVQAAGGIDYAVDRLEVWEGEDVPPADAFLNEKYRELVGEARYVVAPQELSGDQDVAILLQLADGSIRTENAVLSVQEPVLHMELGSEVTPAELLGRGFEDAEISLDLSGITEIGSYPVTVTNGGKEKEFTLVVQDTVAPVVKFKDNLTFYLNQKLTVADFVKSCDDLSPVDYHFSEQPSTLTEGIKDISLIATDAAGNSTTIDLEYLVEGDGEPPVISGVKDMQTIAGIPVYYMRGVKAIDGGSLETKVTVTEPEGFSIRKAGTYEITYTSEDQVGNVAEVTAKLTVLPSIDDVAKLGTEDVYRIGDAIVEGLKETVGDKDQKKLARAIYDYVQGHMFYADNKDIIDWKHAAVVAIYNGYGDCRNYYAFSRLLLSCAEIENMTVEKEKTNEWENAHYWNLIKINGAWYHFDTTPRFDVSDFFMWTDAQMDNYSSWNNNCFNRDKSLYPATPN